MNEKFDNGWEEWRQYVLRALKDNKSGLENNEAAMQRIEEQLTQLRIDVAKLKLRAGTWGLIGGAIPIAISFGIAFLVNLFSH